MFPLWHVSAEPVRHWLPASTASIDGETRNAYRLLHGVLATATNDGLVPVSPCQIERAMNPPRKREPIILSVPEIAELANAVPQRFTAMVLVSAWCGPRWGEVTELRRTDIGAGLRGGAR